MFTKITETVINQHVTKKKKYEIEDNEFGFFFLNGLSFLFADLYFVVGEKQVSEFRGVYCKQGNMNKIQQQQRKKKRYHSLF